MKKRMFAALLALLLIAGLCGLPALAEGPPTAEGGTAEGTQPADPVPEPPPTPAPQEGGPAAGGEDEPSPKPPEDGTQPPADPTPRPGPDDPAQDPPSDVPSGGLTTQPPDALPPPENTPPPEPTPPEDVAGCDTQAELLALLRADAGGVIILTGDVAWSEDTYFLDVQNPVVVEMGDYGIHIQPDVYLDVSGPVQFVGSGVRHPLFHVEGYFNLGGGGEVRATGDGAVAVLLDGALWYNGGWATIRAEGAGAAAVRQIADGDRGDEVELYLTRVQAPGENAVGIDAQVPVRLIQSVVEAGGESVVSTGAITVDASAASPMPQGARVIRRNAVPGSWHEWLGLSVTASGDWPVEIETNTIYYELYDLEGAESARSVSRPAAWSGLPADLSTPGDYPLTCTPEPPPDWYPLELPAYETTLHVVAPDRLWLGGVTMTSFGAEHGQLQLDFLTPVPGAELVEVLASADGGKRWQVVASETPRKGGDVSTAFCEGLTPDTLYLFQARVTGGAMAGLSNVIRFPFTSKDPDQLGGGDWDGGDRDDQGDLPPASEEIPPPAPEPDGQEDPKPKPEPDGPEDGPSGDRPGGSGDRPTQGGPTGPGPEPPPAIQPPPATASPPVILPIVEAEPEQTPPPEDPAPVEDPETPPARPPEVGAAAVPVDPSPPLTMPGPAEPSPVPAPTPPAAPEKSERAAPAPVLPLALCAGALAVVGGALCLRRRKAARPGAWLPLLLAASLAASCLACWLCYRYDNRYTAPRPVSGQGVTHLDMEWYDANPLFYLADGWAFYRDKLLSPAETGAHAPDAFFYLGRYGGYDLGDPDAAPHGQGTYRTVVELDGRPRQFALELTPIFSRWRLWVNGRLMQSVGMGDKDAPAPARDLVTFPAAEQIEIVVETADDTGYYSGMVYPPALGSPQAVDGVLTARSQLHTAAAALALALAVVCLLAGTLLRFAKPYRALSLLCLCLAGATAGPALHGLGLAWTGSTGQRACYYGIFLALLWTVGRVSSLPKRLRCAACGVGIAVCALVLAQPLLPVERAGTLFALSALLGLYKILSALYILAAGAWALRRGKRGSAALLCGGVVFAGALLMDRLLPVYEPVYGGWFVELAGWAILALIGGAALGDTVALYRRDQAQRTELAVRAEHARLQQGYVAQTRERLHETRSRFALLSHYLERGEHAKLRASLDALLAPGDGPGSCQYTGNPLVDAVLSLELGRAERLGAAAELDLAALPAELPYADGDITSLLMNLLDNALEANERLPDREGRWLTLAIQPEADGLRIRCVNAAPPPDGAGTSKADRGAHGFGLPLLRELAARYGGAVEYRRLEDCCAVTVTLKHAPGREEATL